MSAPADPLYTCSECGHVCRLSEMEADCTASGVDEAWSNWICPKCRTWHGDPAKPDSGWR